MGSRVSDLLSAGRSDRSAVHDSVAVTSLDDAIADARDRVEELDRLRIAAAERLLELTRLRGAQPHRGEPNGATEYSPAAKLRISAACLAAETTSSPSAGTTARRTAPATPLAAPTSGSAACAGSRRSSAACAATRRS